MLCNVLIRVVLVFIPLALGTRAALAAAPTKARSKFLAWKVKASQNYPRISEILIFFMFSDQETFRARCIFDGSIFVLLLD